MDAAYLAQLPEWLVSRIKEIEDSTNLEVEVIVDPGRVRFGADAPGTLASEPGATFARVITPVTGYFPVGSVLHEVLHLRRMLLQGVPRLDMSDGHPMYWTPGAEKALTQHDNILEHLLILPEELGLVPDRRVYWERKIGKEWASLKAALHWTADETQRALANWLLMQHTLPDCEHLDAGKIVLEAQGLEARADAALGRVVPCLGDKRALSLAWCEVAGIDPEHLELEFFCPPSSRSEPLRQTA